MRDSRGPHRLGRGAQACARPLVTNACLWGTSRLLCVHPSGPQMRAPASDHSHPLARVFLSLPSVSVTRWLCFTGAKPWGGGVRGDGSLPPRPQPRARVRCLHPPGSLEVTRSASQKPSPLRAT